MDRSEWERGRRIVDQKGSPEAEAMATSELSKDFAVGLWDFLTSSLGTCRESDDRVGLW